MQFQGDLCYSISGYFRFYSSVSHILKYDRATISSTI